MAQMNKQEKHDREVPVGKLFFSIPRTSNEVPDIETTMIIWKMSNRDFFTNIHNVIQNDTEDSFYNICVILNNLRKKILKQIGSEILQNGNMLGININK